MPPPTGNALYLCHPLGRIRELDDQPPWFPGPDVNSYHLDLLSTPHSKTSDETEMKQIGKNNKSQPSPDLWGKIDSRYLVPSPPILTTGCDESNNVNIEYWRRLDNVIVSQLQSKSKRLFRALRFFRVFRAKLSPTPPPARPCGCTCRFPSGESRRLGGHRLWRSGSLLPGARGA